ncbi:MAG: hypothetical protein EOO43_04775 [Flavobacterium sp.]|nr:MAG: hypothetical protein EOO43_04775 [Flavobacterium sp.]
MTLSEAKRAEAALKSYQFKALLSVLTTEQREQYNAYIQEHLPDLKATLVKFLAPHNAEDIISDIKKLKSIG